MARAHLREVFLDAEGRPLVGATVNVYDQGTTNTIAATIYTVDDSVGNTSTTSPLTTDSQGAIEFYLAAETRLDLKVSKTGYSDTTETYDVLTPGAGGGGGAPTDAEYIVGSANGSLSAERVITNSTSNTFDTSVAGQVQVQRAALTGDVTASANSNATTIANDAVSDAKLRNSAGLSVIGRSANSTGDPADIAAANDAEVLRRSGTTLGFGTIATAGIANEAVTYAKIQNVSAASKLLGRGSAGGAGDAEEITLGTNLSMSGTTLNASGGSGDVATDAIWDAKGDLAVGTGANTAQRLAVGANDTVVMAASGEATGLKFGTGRKAKAQRSSSTQSINNSSGTTVSFDTEVFDTDGMWTLASNPSRITIQVAGNYIITGCMVWANNSTGIRQIAIQKNGTTLMAAPVVSAGVDAAGQMTVVVMDAPVATDYYELWVWQNSGAALNLLADPRNHLAVAQLL